MFVFQLKSYYEHQEDVQPPLKLESCIIAQADQVFISEPLVSAYLVVVFLTWFAFVWAANYTQSAN